MVLLPVILVPAGEFLAFRLFPLHFLTEVRHLRRIGSLVGRHGVSFFGFMKIS